MYDLLYSQFPRQIAYPYRRIVNKKEFYSIINNLNGKVRVFSSVYNYVGDRTVDRINLDLDKIFFDFDGDNALENARVLGSWLIMHNYKFILLYSGGGFHVYLFTENYKVIENKKSCLLNIHKWFIRNLGLQIDRTIVGDIARVATIPNTWNTKRKRFCIPVTLDDIDKGIEYINKLAENQRFDYESYGSKLFDVTPHISNDMSIDCEIEVNESMIKDINNDELLKELPLCISSLLYKGISTRVGWRGRYLIYCYFRDSGIPYGNACNIINKYLVTTKNGKTESYHSLIEENQGKKIYERDESMFPSCESLKREGYCPINGFCNKCRRGDGMVHIQNIYR